MVRRTAALILLAIATLNAERAETQRIAPADAAQHAGETATVCGMVVSTRYSSTAKGQPTWLNLDVPYPHHVFTLLIWGKNRAAFGTPEKDLDKKRVCATGTIDMYKGKAQMILRYPTQLSKE